MPEVVNGGGSGGRTGWRHGVEEKQNLGEGRLNPEKEGEPSQES